MLPNWLVTCVRCFRAVLDHTSSDDRVSHTEEQTADADDTLPPAEPTTNEAPAEDEDAEEMEDDVEDD